MNSANPASAHEIVEGIVALVRERLAAEQVGLVEHFVRRFYSGTAAEDLRERPVGDLYGAALAVWSIARHRMPGEARVRAYNPEPQQHGWQSTHTVVELVTDDMPFLVDSVRLGLNGLGAGIHLVIHPVMRVGRDSEGKLLEVAAGDGESDELRTESVMQILVDRHTEAARLEALEAAVRDALTDVGLAVEDWREMRARLRSVLEALVTDPPPLPPAELEAGRAFLEWLDNDHFMYLGYRVYDLERRDGADVLRSQRGSSLGILRRTADGGESAGFAALPEAIRALAREPELLIVTKANSRATVHRPGHMDHIGIKRFDADGHVIGEHRFLGLFTSAAYNRTPRDIPMLREKLQAVTEQAGYPQRSHASKALLNILETFPRDELFQVPAAELLETALGILHLQERQRIRLFVHSDRYARFCSCIVYVPRERFNTQLREVFQEILVEAFGAEDLDFNVWLSESLLARLYFKLRLPVGAVPAVDVPAIEARMRAAARGWGDELHEALVEHRGEERGNALFARYSAAFRGGYRENYAARIAVHDIDRMEMLREDGDLAMSLFRSVELDDDELEFKLYRSGPPIPLSDALPMLENMGLKVIDERPSKVKRADGVRVWIHDFGMRHSEPSLVDVDEVRGKFHETFLRVWNGDAENDGLNRLVLRAGLAWREIVMLRACAKYLRQAGIAFSHDYMSETLARNPAVTERLVALFHTRQDPARASERDSRVGELEAEINAALEAVANLDEDRILRSFLDIVRAMLRTNYYQPGADGEPKAYLSFKLDPHAVPELPEPRPMFEIFVYSPRVEGVHLRGGTVARGGLRWSDRREDFRTEVLGLMKAQMVKNAVIVPVGSKGGFVPKHLPEGDREAMLAEGKECYRIFIRGLLDLTDNLVDGEVVAPPSVVRHDPDDPYLVVAADKGTATFSDIANGIAIDYGFWLGDAFASGGSQGYDHKGMGITARGAWESVMRHFRELGLNTQTTPFTVVGIGDMSGDVFGNGMLLSEQIKLVGAFNHLHIFLDPDPDPALSFAERKRMFALPRSTWDDYDDSLISGGGGVFARSAKSVTLSTEVRALLGVEEERMTPNELIRAMLRAPVDLLWNGGIGTYVKSKDEHHDDAGDRANEGVRIDAPEIRARVVGEGGNLGFTQRGRIEAALGGVRINTDAIDNAGGVDCSDHEVNIKVLLNAVVAAGDLTDKQRNTLLAQMTDDVGALVLRSNYLQTQALSLASAQAVSMLDVHARLMRTLELEGELAREIEFLPGKEALDERQIAGIGLTAPELSVLMAYVKIRLFRQLVESEFALDAALDRELLEYFPVALRERYAGPVREHRLAAEVVCTVIANELVNRCGITYVYRLGEETGAGPADIARAYMVARDSFGVEAVWEAIEALDGAAAASAQTAMLLEARKLVERATRWLLRNRPRPTDVKRAIEFFSESVAAVSEVLSGCVSDAARERIDLLASGYVAGGVPEELAHRVAAFDELYSALDIAEVAAASGLDVADVAAVYFGVTARLDLEWLRDQVVALPRANRWQTLSRAALRDELYEQIRAVTAEVVRTPAAAGQDESALDAWLGANAGSIGRVRHVMADLQAGGPPDFAMLSVAMREVRSVGQGAVSEPPARAPAKPRRKKTAKKK